MRKEHSNAIVLKSVGFGLIVLWEEVQSGPEGRRPTQLPGPSIIEGLLKINKDFEYIF